LPFSKLFVQVPALLKNGVMGIFSNPNACVTSSILPKTNPYNCDGNRYTYNGLHKMPILLPTLCMITAAYPAASTCCACKILEIHIPMHMPVKDVDNPIISPYFPGRFRHQRLQKSNQIPANRFATINGKLTVTPFFRWKYFL